MSTKLYNLISVNFVAGSMTNEANIFYKPLRRVSFSDCNQTTKNTKSNPESINMHVVTMACEEPAKLIKSPRLMVCYYLPDYSKKNIIFKFILC